MTGPALTDRELEKIELEFCRGLYDDEDVGILINALHAHRKVLRQLFGYFKSDLMRRISTADPVRNSELSYLKELVSMEDQD